VLLQEARRVSLRKKMEVRGVDPRGEGRIIRAS
jgi:hypothetical protein